MLISTVYFGLLTALADTAFGWRNKMSVQVIVDLPEDIFPALRRTPEAFVREMRLAAAAKWYEIGVLSQGKAAELAGLSRQEFLFSLNQFGVSPFQVTPDELRQEWERG
jgi:predicted HTH domain antitoxin